MSFKVQIQNLGKLANATVNVAPLTILAGPNNTGKSFFSKAMYSVFDAMNENPVGVAISDALRPLRRSIRMLNSVVRDSNDRAATRTGKESVLPEALIMETLDGISESIELVVQIAASCPLNGDADPNEDKDDPGVGSYPKLTKTIMKMKKSFDVLKPELDQWIISRRGKVWMKRLPENIIKNITKQIDSVCRAGALDRFDLVVRGITLQVSKELSENFQVEDPADLIGSAGQEATVKIDGVGSFAIGESDRLKFEVSHIGLLYLQNLPTVVYLESPVLWKLKLALDRLRSLRSWRYSSDEVPDVPGYFYDLADALKVKYQAEPIAQNEVRRLASNIVKGRIVVDESTWDLQFVEEGVSEPRALSIVATGIANLGVLGMLVERKIIRKNSFLFIDEPEAHLHPAWQVEMISLLLTLAREGVYVVLATHSINILKWLEVHVKNNSNDKDLVALNHFSAKGVTGSDKEFEGKMNDILLELTHPFHLLRLREF